MRQNLDYVLNMSETTSLCSTTMQVWINQQAHQLPPNATLADAVHAAQVKPPFAAAVNTQFVPRTQYEQHRLNEGDRIELISPITGG